jgi:phenylacetate-coenzyme A ligase PaaK-like adenylate-forming protein
MTTSTMTTAAALRDRLPDHLDRLRWDRDRLEAHQAVALRELLRHARERSPFHADRLAGIDLDDIGLDGLDALPTMTKAEMMGAFDDVVTDRRVTLDRVEEHLAATGADASLLLGEHAVLASGGSSGQRGVFVYPFAGIVDYTLGLVRAGLGRALALGEPPPGGLPVAMVAAPSAVHASRALSSLFSGDLLSVTTVPVTLPLPEVVARLNALQPLLLQGYPSVLSLLADEQVAGRLHISPLAVTGSSEQFPAEDRQRVGTAFGVGVVDQFGSSEGVLGVSEPGSPVIALAADLAIVELVDEHHRPVPTGTPSAKVLVTNLIGTVQPLIRYELTDRFVRQPDVPGDGHPRVTVDGRDDELLRYGDVVIHPLVVRSTVLGVPAVVEHQVRQTARGVDVDVVASAGVDVVALEQALAGALGRAGLRDPGVRVRRVDGVPRHPRTGKVQRVVPLR